MAWQFFIKLRNMKRHEKHEQWFLKCLVHSDRQAGRLNIVNRCCTELGMLQSLTCYLFCKYCEDGWWTVRLLLPLNQQEWSLKKYVHDWLIHWFSTVFDVLCIPLLGSPPNNPMLQVKCSILGPGNTISRAHWCLGNSDGYIKKVLQNFNTHKPRISKLHR